MAESEAATTKAGGAFSGLGGIATVAFAAVGAAAVAFAASSVKAYQEHEDAVLKLQTTIKNSPQLVGASTAAFEKQATSLQNLTGFQDEEVLKADAVLGRFNLTADQLKTLNPLVLDYARATGMDAATAAGALGKAMLGNTRALKTLGISFTATGDTTKDFNTIVGDLQSKVGGLAETFGKTAAGQAEILAAKFDDVKEAVGKALIPVITELLGLLQSLIPVAQKLADELGTLATELGTLSDVGDKAAFSWQNFGDRAKAAGDIATRLFPGFHDLYNSVRDFTSSLFHNGDALDADAQKAKDSATQQAALSQATHLTTAAMKAQREAAQQLAGGLLGLTADAQDLADKQRVVNKLQDQGHDSGARYNSAVLDLLNSQEQFKADIGDFITKLKESGLTLDAAINKVVGLGKAVGLTRKDVLDALGPLDQYRAKLGAIPSSVSTNIVTQYTTTGHLPGRHLAAGGIVTKPTVALIGEAGPEAVVPLSGNTTGPVSGDVILQIDGQTFARIARDQLLKLGKRNVTAGIV